MAVIYLRSTDGSDASDGSTWANAKATLAAALTAAGSGGTVYVSGSHAESDSGTTTMTLSGGTAASPIIVLCVDDTGDPEPPTVLATTASVTRTGAGVGSTVSFAGFGYMYGVQFDVTTGGSASAINWTSTTPWFWKHERCSFTISDTSSASRITAGVSGTGSDDQRTELVNCTLKFGHVSQGIVTRCPFIWSGSSSSVAGATVPTTLFLPPAASNCGFARITGVDLSAMGSGQNLVSVSGGNFSDFRFENCKLGSSVSISTGSVNGQGGTTVRIINCDSADTNYRYHKQTYQGTITHETTIVRTDGATDGTTPISRKMVTTANSKFFSPLEADPVLIWNETTGSAITATVEIITDNVTLTDAGAWIEVEYLGTSGFPLSLTISDRAANVLATPANQTSSSETWTTTGLSTPVKQKLSATFTPQEKGVVAIRVMLAAASTTMYFCPKPDIS